MKVFAYIRKSTDDARIQQHSLEYQKRAIFDRFEKEYGNNIEFFLSSESATKKGREIFNKVMNDIKKHLKKGEEVVLLAHEVDRLLRNYWDLAMIYDLVKQGIKIRTIVEDFISPHSMPYFSMKAIWAVEMVENMKRKMREAYIQIAKQGKTVSGVARGYMPGPEKGIRIPHPEKSKGILQIFEGFLEHPDTLNGFLPKAKKTLKKYGMSVNSYEGVKYILTNRYYIGEAKYSPRNSDIEIIAKGQHETFISKKLFNAVQDKLNGNKHHCSVKHNPLFKGRITCKCGRLLIGEKQKGKYYYRCHIKECDFTSFPDNKIIDSIEAFLEHIGFNSLGIDTVRNVYENEKKNLKKASESERAFISKKISELEDQADRLLEMRMDNEISKDIFKNNNLKIQERIESFSDEFSRLQKEKFNKRNKVFELFLELAETQFTSIKDKDIEEQRMILDILTSNFSVTPENRLFIGVKDFVHLKNFQKGSMVSASGIEPESIP